MFRIWKTCRRVDVITLIGGGTTFKYIVEIFIIFKRSRQRAQVNITDGVWADVFHYTISHIVEAVPDGNCREAPTEEVLVPLSFYFSNGIQIWWMALVVINVPIV